MWQELFWSVDSLRQLAFFIVGVVVAILVIPKGVRCLQERREKQLAKALLKEWGGDCISALISLTPDYHRIQIEIYGGATKSNGHAYNPDILWQDIREGKRNPEGTAMIIYGVVQEVFYTDEERASKRSPPEKTYPFPKGEPVVSRGLIRRILNPMYAKVEIFDIQWLPTHELEQAMALLDSFGQLGHITRLGFISYALHLAQSMEKFGKYLWKLENWSNKSRNKG